MDPPYIIESILFILYDLTKIHNLQIIATMEASKYDSPTFQIGITVPQCLILRQVRLTYYSLFTFFLQLAKLTYCKSPAL